MIIVATEGVEMAKLSSLDKLKILADERKGGRAWYTRVSQPCLRFVTEAAELYLSGESDISSQAVLYRLIGEVIASDYPDDLATWPPLRTFTTWFLLLRDSKRSQDKAKQSPLASTKKQAVSKRKTV